jgi:hypothetical protein
MATWVTRHVRAGALGMGTLLLSAVALGLVPVVQLLSPVS